MRESMKDVIFELIINNPSGIKTSNISKMLNLSIYQAHYYLKKLEMEGKVIRSVYRRGCHVAWQRK